MDWKPWRIDGMWDDNIFSRVKRGPPFKATPDPSTYLLSCPKPWGKCHIFKGWDVGVSTNMIQFQTWKGDHTLCLKKQMYGQLPLCFLGEKVCYHFAMKIVKDKVHYILFFSCRPPIFRSNLRLWPWNWIPNHFPSLFLFHVHDRHLPMESRCFNSKCPMPP